LLPRRLRTQAAATAGGRPPISASGRADV